MLQNVERITIPADTVLFRKGDPCKHFMFLQEGSVRVYVLAENGREIGLYRVEPGELCILTLTSLFTGVHYPAEATTDTEIIGLGVPIEQFHKTLSESPGLRDFVFGLLARRLHEVMLLLEEVAFGRLDIRLAGLLLRLFEKKQMNVIFITHQELAKELGSTREVTSRLLKDMEQQRRCIRLHRGNIELVSQDILRQLAQIDR